LLSIPDESVAIEVGASQRREQISRLNQAGVINHPRNDTTARNDDLCSRNDLSQRMDCRGTSVHP
jgi:hypothetical protein